MRLASRRQLARFLRASLCALLVSGCGATVAQARESPMDARPSSITVVMDDNYPPFIFRDAAGQTQGILKDSWALWEARTGIAVKLQAMDWAKAQQLMQSGQADVIDTIFMTEPRKRIYDFSAPYATLEVPIFFHQSISGIVNADSLKGFTVGVKDGDACIDVLREHGVEGMKTFTSYSAVIAAAGAGDVRVFCVDQPPAIYLLNQLGVEKEFRHSVPLYTGQFHRAVKKGNAALLKVVEDGFLRITDAERREIERKWYGSAIEGPDVSVYARYAGYALLGVLLAAIVLVFWNLALRGRVLAKTAELSSSLEALGNAKRDAEQTVAQLNATLAALPDLLFEMGLDGKYHDYHSARADLLAAPADVLLGKTVSDVLPAEAAAVAMSAIHEANEMGVSRGKQIMLPRPHGSGWFELSIARKPAEPGAEPRFIVISRDITERKLAEATLAATQRRANVLARLGRELAEATTPKVAAIQILDAARELLSWDASWLQLWNEPQQKMEGLAYFDLVDGVVRDVTSETITPPAPTPMARRVMEGGPQLLLDEAYTDPADVVYGSLRRTASVMSVPIKFANRLIGIVSIQSYRRHAYDRADLEWLHDLATHCAGALVRLRSDDALRESEERFRALAEWSPEAIGVQREGKLLYVNPAAVAMFGATSAQELIGTPIQDLTHPDSRQIVTARMKDFADHDVSSLLIEERFLRLDGTAIDVEVQSMSIVYDGEPAVYIAARDITGRKQAEAARVSLEAQLRESQKMEAIGTLAGGVAHDFNNILATILGNTELARQDLSANPVALESLEEIRKSASRARDLVQQILSFSRRQPAARKPVSLAPVVDESVRLLRATLPARIALEVHCDAGLPAVLADANQIQQVVINLATNAMQAIPEGAGHIRIRLDTVMLDAALGDAQPALRALHAAHPGRALRLTVSDDGVGMEAPTIERIFEPFFTTRGMDKGTGLGLAVVYGIVRTHEGAMTVESRPGHGATFTLYLPVAAARFGAPSPDETAAANPPAPAAAGDRHILYLDDDASLVFLATRLLERRGYRISGFTDQHQALDALRADPASFDLVVTDYNMPGMSGLDVARAVRAIRADLPVAVASGFIDEALRAHAENAGVRELIFKANAVEDLCDAFARLAQTAGEKSNSG